MSNDLFQTWLARWRLESDGDGFATGIGSRLLPVRAAGAPAMLKIAAHPEELNGGALMVWYAGDGAARVLEREGPALLLERATGTRDLAAMARTGRDDEATAILCQVAAKLHAKRHGPPPNALVPLDVWFRALHDAAPRDGGVFAMARSVAQDLLAAPTDKVVLHGDLHHDNVLDGGIRGWLAIDPKGLIGERGFEFANLFRNPDADTALTPGRMRRQVAIVAKRAALEPSRLFKWILAYAGLGAAWSLESREDTNPDLAIAQIAATELGR